MSERDGESRLCALDSIPDGGTRSFPGAPGGFVGLFVVRRGERVWAYANACPHIGLPLDAVPGRFLDRTGAVIVCGVHGARFAVEDGVCFSGPCSGEALEAVPVRVVDGAVMVDADAVA